MSAARTLIARTGYAVLAALSLTTAAIADDRVIYKTKSPYNTIFVTENDLGLRSMRFSAVDGSRQSTYKIGDPEHLELGYIRAILSALAISGRPGSILVVGVGGGTLPMTLHRKLAGVRVDAVDIDPEVVAVARSHFEFREDARLRAYVADGRRFIEDRTAAYDLIILDAYGPDSVPYTLATAEFLQAVKKALTPKGMVIANIWERASNPLYDPMVRTYQHVFGDVSMIGVQNTGNLIFLAGVPRMTGATEQMLEQCRKFATELSIRYDLASVLKAGLRGPGQDGAGAKVLFDADRPR